MKPFSASAKHTTTLLYRLACVESPACFKHNSGTVFHTDKRACRLFKRRGADTVIAPNISRLRVLKLFMGPSNNHFRLVIIHKVKSQVKTVSSNVNDRTATLRFLVKEYSPVGSSSATDGKTVCVIDLPERPRIYVLLCINALGLLSVLISNGQFFSCSLCRLIHSSCIRCRFCHGFLTHNVLAGIKGINSDVSMLAVGSEHMNDLYIFVL